MKITWMGQVALLIETEGRRIMVDPYLSDHLYETVGEKFKRTIPADPKYLAMHPDMILLSHDHGDHLDIPSMELLCSTDKRIEILAGVNAWKKVRAAVGGHHNYVSMLPGTEWSSGEIHIRAVPAVHSDDTAVGYLIHAEGKTIYITGDTLYHRAVIEAVKEPVDVMYVVMNGLGNNMNCIDAARMAAEVAPKTAIPVHWGLFETLSADPYVFQAEAEKRGVKVYVEQIYETVDLAEFV